MKKTIIQQHYPASTNNFIIMKNMLTCICLLVYIQSNAQLVKSDDYFSQDHQRFIQSIDQPITRKNSVTASVFFGTTECSKGIDTLVAIHFAIKLKRATAIEEGSTIVLNFEDGTSITLKDQQHARTIQADYVLTPSCYLDISTWKKIMHVDITDVIIKGAEPKLHIRIAENYHAVIPGMMKMLYERGRAPYNETL